MREQLFRAVITPHKTVITFTLDDLANPHPLFSIRELVKPWLRAGNKPDDYTGLKDKNDKEIYERDILKPDNIMGTHGAVYLVEWDSPEFIITAGQYRGSVLGSFCKYSKVIGNIYENPELLKKVK